MSTMLEDTATGHRSGGREIREPESVGPKERAAFYKVLSRMSSGVAHELGHPSEVISSNATTLEEYLGVLQKLLIAYEQMTTALSNEDRRALGAALHHVKHLHQSEDVPFIVEDLGRLLEEFRLSMRRLLTLAKQLRTFAPDDPSTPETLVTLIDAALEVRD